MYVRYYHPREKRFLRWNSADRMTPGKRGKPLSGRHLPDRACIDSPWIRELSGRGVAVAVIDSGVNPEHPHVSRAAGGVGIKLSGDVSEDFVDRLGHGTAVFAAIQEKAPEADLFAAWRCGRGWLRRRRTRGRSRGCPWSAISTGSVLRWRT